MRAFSVLLLLLTGTVFVTSPATLIAKLTPNKLSVTFWIVVILVYYILATLLPIDKLIGRLYQAIPLLEVLVSYLPNGLSWTRKR